MNAPHHREESHALAVADHGQSFALDAPMNAAALILGPAFDRVQTFAALMSKGAVTVPQHLRNNPGDCMAVTLAALSRRMDPFAFAQKTHITKSGALGYEAQLVKAMITTSGAIQGQPEYEFLGDWTKILGKVEEKTSDKGGKYYVAKYTKADEEGLGVVIRARLRGEQRAREMTVMLSQCYPRFSTQWATDPQQQICYVADRKFARRYCPETILGIYDTEELDEPQEPKFMGPADVVPPTGTKTEPTNYPQDQFDKNLPSWREVIAKGRKTPDQIITMAETKHPLTEAQKEEIRKSPGPKAQAQDVTPKVTYAQLADRLHAAADREAAVAILDEAGALPPDQKADLQKIVQERFPQD